MAAGVAIAALASCSAAAPPKASVAGPVGSPTTHGSEPAASSVASIERPTETTAATAFVTVVSRFDDFSISVPGDWNLLTPSAEDLTTLGSNLDGSLTGISGSALVEDAASIAETTALWAQSPEPSVFRENIQIIRLPGRPELTLESLSEMAVSQVTSMGLVNVSIDPVQVAGLDGVRLTSRTGDSSAARLFQSSVFLVNSDQVWVINFATDDQDTLVAIFDNMLDSFQLLNPSS